ncbi:hypothetical protein [Luteimonas changyuni]|uniref:hypothetical protein n=1 Tax=Luteimonas sp. MJ145 TaxID=3129234 RepID=UPI0031BB9805
MDAGVVTAQVALLVDAALLGKALFVATLGITQFAAMTLVLGFTLALLGDASFAFALVNALALAPLGLASLVGVPALVRGATLVRRAALVRRATLLRRATLVRRATRSGIRTLFGDASTLLHNAASRGIVAPVGGPVLRCFAAARGVPLLRLALLCLALLLVLLCPALLRLALLRLALLGLALLGLALPGLPLLQLSARRRPIPLPGIALSCLGVTALPGRLFRTALAPASAIASARGLVALALLVGALARLASRLLPPRAVVIALMGGRVASRTLLCLGRCRKRDPDRQHDREEHGDWMQAHCGAPWSRSPPLHGGHA